MSVSAIGGSATSRAQTSMGSNITGMTTATPLNFQSRKGRSQPQMSAVLDQQSKASSFSVEVTEPISSDQLQNDFMDKNVGSEAEAKESIDLYLKASRDGIKSVRRFPDIQMNLQVAEGKVDMNSPEYDEMHDDPRHEKRMEALMYHE